MKNKILSTLLIFAFSFAYCQQKNLQIIDVDTKNPIQGAYVSAKTSNFGFSDDLGNLEIDSKRLTIQDSICISHISYQNKCISISSLKSSVELTYEENMLEEVSISFNKKTPTEKQVLKNAKKRFLESQKIRGSYWSEMNLKQIASLKQNPQSYLETDGLIMMNDHMGSYEIFDVELLIPQKVRRIEESELIQSLISKKDKKLGYIQTTHVRFGRNLIEANRIFSRLHPLGKKQQKYDFRFLEEEIIDGEYCYVIEYKTDKTIELRTRDFNKVFGKLWVKKADYSLVKDESSFHFEKIRSITISNKYLAIDNVDYPIQIKSNSNTFTSDSAISTKAILNFSNIIPKAYDNIKRQTSLSDFFYHEYFPYDPNYWRATDLNIFEKDINILSQNNLDAAFTKGAESKVYSDNNIFTKYPEFLNNWQEINQIKEETYTKK